MPYRVTDNTVHSNNILITKLLASVDFQVPTRPWDHPHTLHRSIHRLFLNNSAPPCPSMASLSATKRSAFSVLTASPVSCGSKTPLPTTASRSSSSSCMSWCWTMTRQPMCWSRIGHVPLMSKAASETKTSQAPHSITSHRHRRITTNLPSSPLATGTELRQRMFAQRLRYENRQFHSDVLFGTPFNTLPFAAHERRVRAELRAGKRQLQDCSVDLVLGVLNIKDHFLVSHSEAGILVRSNLINI